MNNAIKEVVDNLFEDICDNSGFLNDLFEEHNLGIFTGRMTGKTYLSSYIIMKHISGLNYSPIIYSLSDENPSFKMKHIGHYYNKNFKNEILYDFKNMKHFNSIPKLIEGVVGVKADIVYIDEIFYWKFTDYELSTFFEILRAKGIKIIINSTVPDWTKTEYINKLKQFMDFILIEDKIIKNLRGYNINLKIKNILERING